MNKIKKGLGRGLSSLIGETKIEQATNKLSISDLYPNKFQPRKIFDEDSLNDLEKSIKERGIIQPIIVRKSNEESKYEIIAGERRWLAAQKAGLHEVPVVVTEADDLKSLEFAIVENVQRNDLNPLEEAQGYQRLINDFSYDQEKVSKFIGKSRSYITNCLRILTLPSDVLNLIQTSREAFEILQKTYKKAITDFETGNIRFANRGIDAFYNSNEWFYQEIELKTTKLNAALELYKTSYPFIEGEDQFSDAEKTYLSEQGISTDSLQYKKPTTHRVEKGKTVEKQRETMKA